MTKVLLHTDSGAPYVPSNFVPDNGLASLAGSLYYSGHEPVIVDRNTLENFGLLIPEKYRGTLRKIFDSVVPVFSNPDATRLDKAKILPQMARLVYIDRSLAKYREELHKKQGAELAKRIVKEDIDIVGFKYFFGSPGSTIPACEEIKKAKPETLIVAGGPLIDTAKESPGAIFEANPYLDVVVFGEGEAALVEIVDRAKKGKDLKRIPGTIYRDGSGFKLVDKDLISDLDSLPEPYYGPHSEGQLPIRVYEMNRGCYGNCPHCVHSDKSGNLRRTKSTEKIISELGAGIDDGITTFIEGSSSPNMGRAYDVAKEINRRGWDIKYVMFGSALEFKEELIGEMAESGLDSIFFGFESGDQKMLAEFMRKGGKAGDSGIFLEKLEKAVNASRDAGVYPVGSIMWPVPNATEESRKLTLEAAKKIFGAGGSVPLNFAGLYPNSEWGRNPEKYGFKPTVDYPHGYIMKNVNYKIKTLIPPPLLWEDLGYEMYYYGKYRPFKEFAKETGELRKDLRREGVTLAAAHDTILIGHCYDREMPEADFINYVSLALITGDVEKIGDMIDKID